MPGPGGKPSAAPLRIVVLDDDPFFRTGLTEILELEGFDVLGVGGSRSPAIDFAVRSEPDVVALDIDAGDPGGIKSVRRLRATGWAGPIIALTIREDDAAVIAAIAAGVTGYLLKDAPRDEIVSALRAAAFGHSVLSPRVAGRFLAHARLGVADQQLGADVANLLSVREREVLAMLGEGKENPEIAAELYISESTVKRHVSSVLSKLDAHNRVEAAVLSSRVGRSTRTPAAFR